MLVSTAGSGSEIYDNCYRRLSVPATNTGPMPSILSGYGLKLLISNSENELVHVNGTLPVQVTVNYDRYELMICTSTISYY